MYSFRVALCSNRYDSFVPNMVSDLQRLQQDELITRFGVQQGSFLYLLGHKGRDDREVSVET